MTRVWGSLKRSGLGKHTKVKVWDEQVGVEVKEEELVTCVHTAHSRFRPILGFHV